MTDVPLRRWLADDPLVLNTVFLITASALALALTSCLWHHIHLERPSVDQQHSDSAPSIFSAAFSSFHASVTRTVPSTSQQQSLSVPTPGLAVDQQDRKSTRSKERRRRGKDPFRDLLKGEKKSNALLKSNRATDHDHSPLLVDTLSSLSVLGNDTASSTSRSQSPEPASDLLDRDRRPCAESDAGSASNTTPNGNTLSTSGVTSSGGMSDHSSPDMCSQTDDIRPRSVSPDSMTAMDTQANISSASTIMGHAPEEAPSSPPAPAAFADTHTLQSRNSQAASTSESCTKLVRARTRLRLSRMDPSVKPPLLLSTTSASPDSVANSFPSIRSIASRPSLSIIASTSHSTNGAGPSTPTDSCGSTPPRSLSPSEDPGQVEPYPQLSDESAASAQSQLASVRSALEAACLREEQLRIEAEQASKERDELRWRWNEDANVWRRREAELQAQIHHLMQQLQAYVAVASFQAQQAPNLPSSGFSSPTSPHVHPSPRLQHHPLVSFSLPPAIQTQNSTSAPAHVQALLASAPMIASHPPGFAVPTAGGLYSGAGLGMSPLLWSGMGLCVPKRDTKHSGRRTPDSSASSSSRGRRRRHQAENAQSASDESSLGDWDGMEDGSGDEGWEEDDVFRNNVLADAILKRPESIRELSGSIGKRSGMGRAPNGGRPPVHGMGEVGRGGAGERMDALKDPALEKHGVVPPLVDTSTVRTVTDAPDRQ